MLLHPRARGKTAPSRRRLPFLAVLGLIAIGSAHMAPPARAARQEGSATRQPAPTREGPRESASPGWFGLALPPGVGETPAVVIGTRGPRPVTLPPGERPLPELDGAAIHADVAAIVAVSKQSRREREVGSGQLWGRISGLSSGARAARWAAERLRSAGIRDVRTQVITQDHGASLWLPLSWEVRLLGDPAFGDGTSDVVLDSAMPLQPSRIAAGRLTAPLVFVGNANPALLDRLDVAGKIAVRLVIPQAHTFFEREAVVSRARDLMRRGAVAVLNVMRQPGNERAKDFSDCGGPCFNVGGRDGRFLERVLDRASRAGLDGRVRAQLSLQTDARANLSAENVLAIVPGKSDENVIVNAHADAWFDGAGDNADGLAVLVALARHFARPERQPARTLVFLASAGHHTPGLSGPRAFVSGHPALAAKTVLVVNVEHVAQRGYSPARSTSEDGYREFVADAGEAPITVGITNRSPFLDRLFDEGVTRYGVNFVSARSDMQSGETLGFAALDAARVTIMQAPPLYHTSGEGLDAISPPGLERMARFLAFFIKQAAAATPAQINP